MRQDIHRVASLASGRLGDQVGAVFADGPAGRTSSSAMATASRRRLRRA